MNNKNTMAPYAALFHHLGYSVLMPDARSHGQSQGQYIGYGWVEKADIKSGLRKSSIKMALKVKLCSLALVWVQLQQ